MHGNGCICVEPALCRSRAPIGPGTEGAARVLCAIGAVACASVAANAAQWHLLSSKRCSQMQRSGSSFDAVLMQAGQVSPTQWL